MSASRWWWWFCFRNSPFSFFATPLSYFPNCWNNSLFMLLLSTPLLVALLRVTVGSDSLVSRFMVTIGKINACRFPWKRNEVCLQTPSLVWGISGQEFTGIRLTRRFCNIYQNTLFPTTIEKNNNNLRIRMSQNFQASLIQTTNK